MATYEKRENGWRVRIRIKGTQPRSKTFRVKKQAEDWARKTEDAIYSGLYVDTQEAEKTTINMIVDRYTGLILNQKSLAAQSFARILAALTGSIVSILKLDRQNRICPLTLLAT